MPSLQGSLVVTDFFDRATEMRAKFDELFGVVRLGSKGRFVWDYWHVADQYTYLRTFPENVFPAELCSILLRRLRSWGRDYLGCDKILYPWLSCYIDGCRQELHADVPQGPWAYVFSLTDWDHRTFSGGETMLLKRDCLDFWPRFNPSKGLEAQSLVELIARRFNQLTVFDPRIPHGVRPVQGTWDILKGRLVLHGWFRYPSPFVCEALKGTLTASSLDSARASLEDKLRRFEQVTGIVTARLDLSPNGAVSAVRTLSNTLVSTSGNAEQPHEALRYIENFWRAWKFPEGAEDAWVTVPVSFPAGQGTQP